MSIFSWVPYPRPQGALTLYRGYFFIIWYDEGAWQIEGPRRASAPGDVWTCDPDILTQDQAKLVAEEIWKESSLN